MSERDALDELSRRLFEAAREEAPDAQQRSRALASAQGAPVETATASHARPLELQPSPAAQPARTSGTSVGSYAGFALAAAACVLLAWTLSTRTKPAASIQGQAIERVQGESEPAARTAAPANISNAPGPVEPTPASTRFEPAVRPARASASATAKQPTAASLSDELALLDQARAALTSGQAPRALALLDRYETKLRPTHLNAEAALLRIEALSKSGQAQEANRRAQRFIKLYPDSPLADRARAWLAPGTGAPQP